jgi:sirohydrochlorin cobaltochelatase
VSHAALEDLDLRLKTILPDTYQDSYESVRPVSMGSAGLKFSADGRVAWDEIWGSFCDLAMAGGPPHKGKLLEPADAASIAAAPSDWARVTTEICRGIEMVAEVPARVSSRPGFIEVTCESPTMAQWLARAISMENVTALASGATLYLPAGPHYRLEKEIKNVVTSIAKTCHYFLDHIFSDQQRRIAAIFAALDARHPLIQPACIGNGYDAAAQQSVIATMAPAIATATGMSVSEHNYAGWLGFTCPGIPPAVWMMRALAVSNILTRREDRTLFLPINPTLDPNGSLATTLLIEVHQLARLRELL